MNWQELLSSNRAGNKNFSAKPERSDFEIDFDRIVFSLPFRRLQDKTQVFPLPEDDFVHNRLTHSLEVSSVGRSLGKLSGDVILKKHPELARLFTAADFGAIVSAASLAHDVGNPPFGHAGETAISDYFRRTSIANKIKPLVKQGEWADLINFEGNAQGFRLINQSLHGLNLTYATLGAFTKYPRQSLIKNNDQSRVSQKKYGFYQSEQEIFADLSKQLGLIRVEKKSVWCRHPLAFLVEAADDICYHIIDLEDGCTLDLVTLDETIALIKPILGDSFDQKKLNKKRSKHEKLGTLRAMAINKLIEQTVNVYLENEEGLLAGSFDQPLISIIPAANALTEIQRLSIDRIYRAKVVLEKEVAGFEVINGLLSTLISTIFNQSVGQLSGKEKTVLRMLPDEISHQLEGADLYISLRIILDFISGMTDSYALTLYRKLMGMALPSW